MLGQFALNKAHYPHRPFSVEDFEASLREGLSERGVKLAGVKRLPEGSREKLFLHKNAAGGNSKQTKIPVFPVLDPERSKA